MISARKEATGKVVTSNSLSTNSPACPRNVFLRIGMSVKGLARRLANRAGMAGIVPELTHGVLCPGRGSLCPGNVKIDHRA